MGIEKSMNSVTLDEVLHLCNIHKYFETSYLRKRLVGKKIY